MHTKIAPSLMNMSLLNVERDIAILDGVASLYHVDIIDGHYVKNMCLTPHFIRQLRQITDKPIEAHLYVEDIDEWVVKDCIDAGATLITMPSDGVGRSVHRLCSYAHEAGAKAGIFLNPYQSVREIEPYIDVIDDLLILSVDPGYTGQAFLPGTYERIREARALRERAGKSFPIAIDGGCNTQNYQQLIEAGCDVLNLGRGLFDNGGTLAEAAQRTVAEVATAERAALGSAA